MRAPITPYFYGMTQCEMTLVAPTVIEAFHRAEKEGYQAAVPLGFLDLGLDGGRAAVDIPVIAPFECSLHLASLLGDRFGLICYHENQFGNLSMLLNRYGMAHKVVGMEASGFDLPDIAANKDAMIENFLKAARKLIDENRAEVIIPTGITQCPVTMNPQMAARSARGSDRGRDRRAVAARGDVRRPWHDSQPQALGKVSDLRQQVTRRDVGQSHRAKLDIAAGRAGDHLRRTHDHPRGIRRPRRSSSRARCSASGSAWAIASRSLLRIVPEYMEVYAAGELGGWATVTINYRLAEPEVAYILADSRPKVLVCEASLA